MAYIRAPKPEQQEIYDFLEDLRQSGETNMFGCGPYLQAEFGLGKSAARVIAIDWMNAHNDPKRIMDKPITDKKAGSMQTVYEPAE